MSDDCVEFLLPPEELVRQINDFGFTMFIGEDGVVHGKASKPGLKVPWEMRPLLDQIRLQNDAVAEVIRRQAQNVVDLNGITQEEASPWLERVRSGEYRLVPGTRVTYEKSTGLTYMELERVRQDA